MINCWVVDPTVAEVVQTDTLAVVHLAKYVPTSDGALRKASLVLPSI